VRVRVILASVFLLLTVPTVAPAASYYVKNGGSDGADGLSLATAWATLNHAAQMVAAGDVVFAPPTAEAARRRIGSA